MYTKHLQLFNMADVKLERTCAGEVAFGLAHIPGARVKSKIPIRLP